MYKTRAQFYIIFVIASPQEINKKGPLCNSLHYPLLTSQTAIGENRNHFTSLNLPAMPQKSVAMNI